MRHLFTLLYLLLAGTMLSAQGIGNSLQLYSAYTIPDSLKKDADAVYRLDESVVDVQSAAKYVQTTHQVITLLNKDAAHHLYQRHFFNKQTKVEDVEIKLYNAFGVEIKKYKKKDFEISSYDDRMSLFTDAGIMTLDIPAQTYPCTIEITTEERISGHIILPSFYFGGSGEASQQARYTIRMPQNMDIRHRVQNIDLKPAITTQNNIKTYVWEVKNLVARRAEYGGYESRNYAPRVEIIPLAFEYDGYPGNFTSWKDFGEWNYKLYEDANPFTPARAEQIKALVATCKDDQEKIKVLYNHLKQTMRYVSIQLGIGGFKPFAVSFVDEKKYGDCKALTNYMRYMLKTVGIKSYPALINGGASKAPADPAFPADPFNHVILCIPQGKDSVWLECTSNISETGFLGNFTENKNALLLTEQGGILVPTPRSNSRNNVLTTKTVVSLNKEGESAIQSSIYCTGDFWATYHYITQLERERQKTFFVNALNYKSPDEFRFTAAGDSATGKLFRLNLAYEQLFDFRSGNKLFFRPRVNKICDEDLKSNNERTTDYLFDFPYEKTDTTVYVLPAGFSLGNLPATKEISTAFGYYKNEVIKNEQRNEVIIVSQLSLKKHIIAPSEYTRVADFIKEVNKNEAEKLIILTD